MKKNKIKKAPLAKKSFAQRLSIAMTATSFATITEVILSMFFLSKIPGITTNTWIALSFLLEFILLGISYLVCTAIIREQTDSVIELTYKAHSIAKGNFHTYIPDVDTENEIKQLRDSFEYMQTSINNIINDVRNTTMENERIESELNIASAIQKAMLPKDFPHTQKLDLCALLSPAREIGGDLYDFYVKGNLMYFTIGDVSGKGIPAALYMAITRSSFRFSVGLDLKINEIISRINNVFSSGNTSQMFVTMFAGVLNIETRQLEFCNAGHNPIIVIDKNGNAQYLRSKSNIAIGLFDDYPYEMETINLEEGCRLLLYTDGITEAERADKTQYGEKRLLEFANSIITESSSEEVMNELRKSVSSFTCGNPQNDDMTIMSFILKNIRQ